MPEQQRRPNTGLLEHRPTTDQQASALYAYGRGGQTGNPWIDGAFGPSFEAGAGLFRGGGRDERTGLVGSAEVLYGDVYNGRREDGTIGRGARVGLFNGSGGYQDHGMLARGDLGLFTAEADAHVGPDDAGFAVGADIINGGFELGTRDAQSSTDQTVGLSAGIGAPGMSAHLLYGDADKDGHREYGFDFSGMFGLGFGVKMTTEDPVRTLMGPVGNMLPRDMNLTDAAVSGAVTAGNAVADGATWAYNQAASGVNWAGEQLGNAGSWAGDQLSSAGNAISEGWNALWDW